MHFKYRRPKVATLFNNYILNFKCIVLWALLTFFFFLQKLKESF